METYPFTDNTEKKQYELHVGNLTPKIEYIKNKNGEIYLTHTEVPSALEGKGIGSQLVEQALKDKGYSELVREKTGLLIDPYFSASGVKWILDNVDGARQKAENGSLLMGTIDSWLIWKLTEGKVHATDYTNASRTLLFNIHTLQWDDELLKLFTIPASMMPRLLPCDSVFGETTLEGLFQEPIQIAGVLGDSHGALMGQMCFEAGFGKATYGTGSSVMMNIGENAYPSSMYPSAFADGVSETFV